MSEKPETTGFAERTGNHILSEYVTLAKELQNWNGKGSAWHQRYLEKFQQIQELFDQFAEEVRGLDAQQRQSLRQIREDVGQCYQEFCALRESFSKEHPEPDESFPDIPENMDSEEEGEENPAQEESMEDVEEDILAEEDDRKGAKKKRRKSRYASRHTNLQQEFRDAATYYGIKLAPDQPVSDADIRNHLQRMDDERRRQADAVAANLERERESLRKHNERIEQSQQFVHLESQHIDMSRDGIGRSSPGREPETPSHQAEQTFLREGEERVQHDAMYQEQYRQRQQEWESQQKKQLSKADQAVEATEKHNAQERFFLKSVTRSVNGIGYVIDCAARKELEKAKYKTENDTLIGLSKGTYYVSTAMGVGSALLRRNPAAFIDRASHTITSSQLSAYSNDTMRRHRDLQSKISETQETLSQQYKAKPSKLTYLKQKRLRSELNSMRRESVLLKVQMPLNQQLNQFRHERSLDREIMESLRPGGRKVPANPKKVNELSQQILKRKNDTLQKKYGQLAYQSNKSLNDQIQHLTAQSKAIKVQIRSLEAKGSALTQVERKKLLDLKKQGNDLSRKISTRIGARNSKADFAYIEKKLGIVSNNAFKRKQQIASGILLLRSFVLRPLDEDQDTQGLRYGIDFISHRQNRRIVTGVAKFPFKATKKTILAVTPRPVKEKVGEIAADVSNRVHLIKQTQVHKIFRSINRGKLTAKRVIHETGRAAFDAAPLGIRTAVQRGAQGYRFAKHKYDAVAAGIQNTLYRTKVWFANTPLGRLMTWQKILNEKLLALFKAAAAFAKSAALWLGLVILLLILLAGIISGIAGSMVGSSSTLILSPAESTSGKINLAPYSQIIRSEMTRFNGEIANVMSRYEDNDAYDNVTMQYSGVSNNSRELLSMMAVRMGQNLDLEQNPNVKDYLVSLYRASHSYSVAMHQYTCEGCEERVVQKVEVDPITGQPTIKLEKEIYCPGHTDVTITVSALAFDAIFAADDYRGSGDNWDGWTEENIAWCKAIYDMDWEELYEGVEIAQDVNIGGIVASANEQQIWNFLMDLTGNAYGAAGLMGNLYAESGLSPTNLQDSYEASLGYDDLSYTNAVDAGTYQNFANDQAGYGLAQWTYHTRKQALLNLAKRRGTSIGNLDTQLAYLGSELSGGSILADLQNASSVREASDIVMIRFENPADQSERAKALRASYCEYYYNKMTLGIAAEGDLTQKQIEVITIAMNSASYGIPANPGYCQQWAAYVYAKAGLPIDSSCCAYHSGVKYGVSDDWNAIPPGAAVYGYSGSQYGHVGIYVGNGLVYHNVGGVAIDSLADWVKIYKGFAWGWLAGSDLTTYD